jgi:CheY-like chemotaxis protein
MAEEHTILIVDDDVDFAESNKDLLEACGYSVVTAHDGSSGLQVARATRPDLMILDVMMATDTDGFEVARAIPQTPELQGLPVLLVTGIEKALNLSEGLKPDETWLPVERILEKPIDPGRLLKEVEKILKKQPPKGESHD